MGDSYQFGLYDIETSSFTQSQPAVQSPNMFSSNLKFVGSRGRTGSGPGDTVAVTVLAAGRKPSSTPTLLYWDLPENKIRRAASTDDWDPARADAVSRDGRLAATPAGWHEKHLSELRDAQTGRLVRFLG